MKKTTDTNHGYKTFFAIFEIINSSPDKINAFLLDKRLTTQEKKLLVFYKSLRSNKFDTFEELQDDNSFEAFPVVNGLRLYFLGVGYLYRAECKKAIDYILMAQPLLENISNDNFIKRIKFKSQANLFYAYFNLKRMEQLKETFLRLSMFKTSTKEDELTIKFINLSYYLINHDYIKAENSLEELQDQRKEMNEIQIQNFLLDKFDFCIKTDHFAKSESILNEMKKHRIFRLSANFTYMRTLLNFITRNETIYITESDFSNHKELLYLLKVIQHLSESDESLAKKSWEELNKLSPKVYAAPFDYLGDKCLFSLGLDKAKAFTKNEATPVIETKDLTAKEALIIKTLMNAPGLQIKKEDLFRIVYNREPKDKLELNNLSSVIYRINKRAPGQIKYKKDCYFLNIASQEAS